MSSATAGTPSRLSFGDTVAALRSTGKPSHHAPLYSRLVNRPLGRYLAAVAHRLGLTPDQVTTVSAVCTAVGIGLLALARPSWVVGVAVTLLLALGYALDSADGQLARLRGGGTRAGEWLDHMVDCAKGAAVHVAVLVSLYRFADAEPRLLLLPVLFGLVTTVMFFGTVLTDQLRRSGGTVAGAGTGPRSAARSFLTAPADYGVLCLAFVFLPWTSVFLAVYAVLFVGTAAYLAAGLVRWHGQVAELDASR
ncbi:CDP-alcohol phosphatidyltransferase family protein [Geodermatophilus sp. SYSU D01036]